MQERRQFIQTEIAQFFLDYHEQKKRNSSSTESSLSGANRF
jgi:hypothetical protein